VVSPFSSLLCRFRPWHVWQTDRRWNSIMHYPNVHRRLALDPATPSPKMSLAKHTVTVTASARRFIALEQPQSRETRYGHCRSRGIRYRIRRRWTRFGLRRWSLLAQTYRIQDADFGSRWVQGSMPVHSRFRPSLERCLRSDFPGAMCMSVESCTNEMKHRLLSMPPAGDP
jgi:hypothetical protein